MAEMLHLRRLDEITERYDVLLCDVWGVLHNGVDRLRLPLRPWRALGRRDLASF